MMFLDSSFVIASKIEDDEHHTKAIKFLYELIKKNDIGLIISDYVFDEIMTVIFVKTKDLSVAIDLGSVLKSAVRILRIDEDIFEKTWEIFKNQKGTRLSFTDCSTLALMENERIKNIATFDKDFGKIDGIKVVG